MKYKGKQGNSYLFECEGRECSLTHNTVDDIFASNMGVYIDRWLNTEYQYVYYKDIQTAVSMMQILIDEGEG